MKIKVHEISEEGLHVEGKESPAFLDIKEPLFRFEAPLDYSLDLMWIGKKNILARGKLSTSVRAQCVRTLEWFDLPLQIDDFSCTVDSVRGDEVDLTEQIREDILLLLPANPISPNAKPLKAAPPKKQKGGGSKVWGTLDKLKLK